MTCSNLWRADSYKQTGSPWDNQLVASATANSRKDPRNDAQGCWTAPLMVQMVVGPWLMSNTSGKRQTTAQATAHRQETLATVNSPTAHKQATDKGNRHQPTDSTNQTTSPRQPLAVSGCHVVSSLARCPGIVGGHPIFCLLPSLSPIFQFNLAPVNCLPPVQQHALPWNFHGSY